MFQNVRFCGIALRTNTLARIFRSMKPYVECGTSTDVPKRPFLWYSTAYEGVIKWFRPTGDSVAVLPKSIPRELRSSAKIPRVIVVRYR